MPHEVLTVSAGGLTRFQFNATPMAVRCALAKAHSDWCTKGIARDVRQTGEQVLAEVLNNVVEHAHADRPDGVVQLETGRRDDGMTCIVRDNGAPLPGLQLPAGELSDIGDDLQEFPEGGFGWFMIRALTQDLSYDRENGWNLLRFRIGDAGDPDLA